jgi:drug/metabolite transporter (DMT)-like permease
MNLSFDVTILVLGAALMHAVWNTILKSSESKLLDTTLIVALGSLIALATLPFLPMPDPASWPWLGMSVALHMLYYFALIGAYHHGDLSHTYPLMRGGAPLLIALAGPLVVHEQLSGRGWLGIGLISLGIIAPALRSLAHPGTHRATAFALANASIIAAYTLVDGRGARASGHAIAYSQWLFFLDGFALTAYAYVRHGRAVTEYALRRWGPAAIGALLSMGAYGIAIWAMTKAPVAMVAALRETSVIIAAIIGATLLKERLGLWRIAGAALVVAGIFTLKL